MPRKKVVTTTTEDQEIGQEETQQTINISPEESELLDYLEALGSSANLVKIYKVVEGRRAYCGQTEPGSITEDHILKKWGGGRYYLLALMNGKYVPGGTRALDLYKPEEDSFRQPMPQANDGAGNGTNNPAILHAAGTNQPPA